MKQKKWEQGDSTLETREKTEEQFWTTASHMHHMHHSVTFNWVPGNQIVKCFCWFPKAWEAWNSGNKLGWCVQPTLRQLGILNVLRILRNLILRISWVSHGHATQLTPCSSSLSCLMNKSHGRFEIQTCACEGTTNCFHTTRLTSSHLDIKEFINTQ